MQSEKTPAARRAVVYVGPPAGAADPDALAAEALRHAADEGLLPLSPVARTATEADALLAAHPDAVIAVCPATETHHAWPVAGRTLWYLLSRGAVLRLCRTGTPRPETPSASEASGAPQALLAVELPGADDAVAAGGPGAHPEREAECRAFATELGLVPGLVLEMPLQWISGSFQLASPHPTTVIVHPDVTPPAPDTPDALLLRWLREGHEIRAVPPLRQPLPLAQSGRDLSSQRRGRPASPGPILGRLAGREQRTYDDDLDLPDFMGSRVHYGASSTGTGTVYNYGAQPQPPSHLPPSSPRTDPLPHDGLFIRRNNAFGTRSVLGVTELIEQGVIVGQEQIRFDDFVAARAEQVPGPRPGEAIAVSHGLAAVDGEFKAHEATTHFLEITLKAGEAHPEDTPAQPLPVNTVFAVDTSGSMYGGKLDTVKAALQALYERLRPEDCLGIITFDHHVRTVLPAVARKDLPPEDFAAVVSRLRADGGTDINLGVQYGIDELGRHASSGRTVNCLYLFSDGDPTSGERDWITIRRNIAAKMRGDFTLSCFGFGSDARMPELAALAGLAGGHATFVTRPEEVGAHLLADLSRRDHLAAIDIQLRLDIDPDVEIRHLYGHDLVTDPRARAAVLGEARRAAALAREDYGTEAAPDIITDEKGVRIFAPDLAFGETYWIVLELAVPPGRAPEPGTATVQYVDTVARESRRHELDLAGPFTLPEETVTVHAVGLWTSEVTFYALDDLYAQDRDAATKRLQRHIQVLQDAHGRVPANEFRDDQITLRKLITLAGSLGTLQSFSDLSQGPAAPVAVKMMSAFGQVRSGFWPNH